jgi:PAS domain S-box-containing protein
MTDSSPNAIPDGYRDKHPADQITSFAESEKRFRMLAESLCLQVWSSRSDGSIDYISRQCLEYVDLPETVLLGIDKWMEMVHPEDRQRVRKAWAKTLSRKESLEIEYRIRRYDGIYRWFKVRAVPVQNSADGTTRWYGSNTDIHDLHETELALRDSELRYKEVFDNSSDCIYILDVTEDGRFRLVDGNPATERVMGFKRSDVLGKYVEEIVSAKAAKITNANYRRCIKKKTVIEYEERYRTVTGIRFLQTTLIPVRDSDDCIRRLIGVARDITEAKLAQEALRQQQRMSDAFFNQAITCFCLLDRNLKYVRVNEAWAKNFNRKVEDFVGRDTIQLNDSIPYRSYWRHLFKGVAKTKRAAQVSADPYEFAGQPERGVTYWDWTLQPILNEKEEIEFFFFSSNDATNRKKAEDKLEEYRNHLEDLVRQRTDELSEAKDKAEAANRAKSIFLANMSHELRTPLNIILGLTQLMTRNSDISTEQQEFASIIGRSGEHLLALINNVLEMSRIEAGHSTLRKRSFDLHQTIAVVEEMMRNRADKKALRFFVQIAPEIPRFIISDDAKLRQVLINLIGNAVKFTQKGSVTLKISRDPESQVNPKPTRDIIELRFEVIDTGIGISPAELEGIFEPFIQARPDQTLYEGTGLGLAISRRFVQDMGGTIWVESVPGKGSVFAFTIAADWTDTEAVSKSVNRVVGLAPNQPRYRILIAENIPESSLLLRKLLESVGFVVRDVRNGMEAIEEFEEWAPHLIWMDLRMPVMNGLETTRRIKATRKGKKVKIIALSAASFEEEKTTALEYGCDDYVRKPFGESEIFEVMARQLGVVYVYDSTAARSAEMKDNPLDQTAIYRAELTELPSELLARFEAAVKSLNVIQIRSLIKEIQSIRPRLGKALAEIAKTFRYDKFISLITEAGSGVKKIPS